MGLGDGGDQLMRYQAGEGDDMQRGDRVGQAFVAFGPASEARGSGEGSLDHPAPE